MGGSPSPPTPPNPSATAQAQTGMNINSAEATDLMNMVNQITPYGALNYNQTGQQSITEPTLDANGNPTGKSVTYDIPTFTATQSYSPVGQQLLNYQQAAQLNTGQAEQSLSGQIANELSGPIQLPGVPGPMAVPTGQYSTALPNVPNPIALPGAPTAIQTPNAPGVVSMPGSPGSVQLPNAPDLSNQAIDQEMYSEYSPRIQLQQAQQAQATAAQLRAQGLTPGSAAYNNAMTLQNQAFNDQWNEMYLTGRQQAVSQMTQGYQNEYQRAVEAQAQAQQNYANTYQNTQSQVAQQQQQFANILNAQQQTFGQNQQTYADLLQGAVQGTQEQQDYFSNQYQNALNQETQNQQNYANAMATTSQAQNEMQQYYQNLMTNTMQQYNFPLQTLATVMGGSSPQSPSFGQTPTTSVSPANYEGDVQSTYADQMSAYNAQMQQQNAMMGGIFSLFGTLAGGLMSDKRVKEGVNDNEPEKVGELENDLPVYLYRYKAGGPPQIGVMAQDVEKVNPEAVHTIGGLRFVDYRKAVR